MRLEFVLPQVETGITEPEECPYEGCKGQHFRLHQEVDKPIRDIKVEQLKAYRYECLRCRRTFRVYPLGVDHGQTSQRVKGLAVMLYLLGLSYGAVSIVLGSLGAYLCKSQVYNTVQEMAQRVPGLERRAIFAGYRTPALGADLTSVMCNGEWLILGLAVDAITGTVLSIDELSGEDAATLQKWLEPIAEAVGAQILVSDDADNLKIAADNLEMQQQVCKSHVKRNTEALIEDMLPKAQQDVDGSLAAIQVSSEQAVADLRQLGQLICTRRPQDEQKLEELHQRYQSAAPPKKGQRASLAYRMRLLFLDRWNLWRRLTRYRLWQGPQGQTLDGTNNVCERSIGWWIKERYRSMRGYKRSSSALNVSRLTAYCGNRLNQGGLDLQTLFA